ncbi:MAG TPA: peptide chain release factor N(5)-glutamine methyltransferase [Ferruginibacter sp.]|nr:peptide chain release factor N(5)-glutamine methyltransferase [Ferruginibacter sp.]
MKHIIVISSNKWRSSKFVLLFIKELYRNFLVQLQQIYSLSEATVIADWVFEKIAGVKRTELIKNPSLQLGNKTTGHLNQAFAQLLQHKPVQYVLGEAWFYHMKLKVNSHVLIPRPETEELVELLVADRKSKLTDPAILDIGTGSGCIPIAIKKNLPASMVTSVDVSEDALSLAKENAAQHNTSIRFIQMDFLDESNWSRLPRPDVIISNPPYIPLKEKDKLNKNVSGFEPHLALFVPDASPLIFYEKIADFGKKNLMPDGKIYLETHEEHAEEVMALFIKRYAAATIKKDMYGKERMVVVSI